MICMCREVERTTQQQTTVGGRQREAQTNSFLRFKKIFLTHQKRKYIFIYKQVFKRKTIEVLKDKDTQLLPYQCRKKSKCDFSKTSPKFENLGIGESCL